MAQMYSEGTNISNTIKEKGKKHRVISIDKNQQNQLWFAKQKRRI